LKILKRELKHIIRILTDIKDFVFADPLLPYGTIREATAHLSTFGFANTQCNPEKPKELKSSRPLSITFLKVIIVLNIFAF